MSKQEWSNEVPVEDGWYWIDDPLRYGKEAVRVVDNGQRVLRNGIKLVEYTQTLTDQGCEWLGPLTPPE